MKLARKPGLPSGGDQVQGLTPGMIVGEGEEACGQGSQGKARIRGKEVKPTARDVMAISAQKLAPRVGKDLKYSQQTSTSPAVRSPTSVHAFNILKDVKCLLSYGFFSYLLSGQKIRAEHE